MMVLFTNIRLGDKRDPPCPSNAHVLLEKIKTANSQKKSVV